MTYFDRPPEFSPNGRRAVELVLDEDLVSSRRRGLNIWKRTRGAFWRVWSAPLKGIDGCKQLRWVSNIEARFQCDMPEAESGSVRFTVVRTPNGWRLKSLEP